jgi:hypothetical protein
MELQTASSIYEWCGRVEKQTWVEILPRSDSSVIGQSLGDLKELTVTHIDVHTHTHKHTHRGRFFWELHNMSNVCPSLLRHEAIINIVLSTWGRFALVMSALAILKQWRHAASLMLPIMSNVFPRPDLFCGKLEQWTWFQASSAK